MKKFLLSILVAGTAITVNAQADKPQCASDEIYQQMLSENPAMAAQEKKFNDQAELLKYVPQTKSGNIRYIPLVFHVFHRSGSEDISDGQIQSEVDQLNENYRRLGAKGNQTREIFQGVAADIEIEFRLARKDPDGNCTNGIVRVFEEETENGTDNIKLKSVWPTDKYLNVWVVEKIVNFSSGLPGIAGYAQFPWSGKYGTDGVIIIHDNIGNMGTSGPWNASTATHEIGHWLGCYHTFQDSCAGGDKVDDTPPAADIRNTILSCDFTRNTCGNDNPDLPDQIENYMDYTQAQCQNMFTVGQKARMNNTLAVWRPIISSVKNLVATGTDVPNAPANCPPIADFYSIDNLRSRNQSACAGGSAITFKDNSYNFNGSVNRNWIFEGGNPATSSAVNPTVSYANPGKYKVTLIVSNSFGSDTVVKENFVDVASVPAAQAAQVTQDFESDDYLNQGWSISSTTFIDFTRQNTGQGSISGNNSLMAANGSSISGSRFDLYSPSIDASTISNPYLSFYWAFAQRQVGAALTNDALRVYYSLDCGQTWIFTTTWQKTGSNLATSGGTPISNQTFIPSDRSKWKLFSSALPSSITAAQRKNIKFRFQFVSNGGNNFYIDAINLGYPASVHTDYYNADENFNVFPNPANNTATIGLNLATSSNVQLAVYDIYGRQVAELAAGQMESGEHTFDFESGNYGISNGIYFVKLNVDSKEYTRKLMIIK